MGLSFFLTWPFIPINGSSMVFSAFCVYWCIASTFLALRCFKISCMIYSLTHQLLRNMLFNFHIFVNSLELFLSLISDFVNWIMKLQSKLQSLHLLIFVLLKQSMFTQGGYALISIGQILCHFTVCSSIITKLAQQRKYKENRKYILLLEY